MIESDDARPALDMLGQLGLNASERTRIQAHSLRHVHGTLGKGVVAGITDSVFASDQVREMNHLDVRSVSDGLRQNLAAMVVQPDAVHQDFGQPPPLSESSPRHGVIHADDLMFDLGDARAVRATQPNGAIEALGQALVESHLADVMNQAAHKRFLGLDRSVRFGRDELSRAGHREAVLPKLRPIKRSIFDVVRRAEDLKNLDGQSQRTNGTESQQHHRFVDGGVLRAHADRGFLRQRDDLRGE